MRAAEYSTAFRFALREARHGLKYFKIFIACLFMGTAIIAGVGSLSNNITQGIAQDARALLGGDIQISLLQKRLKPEERAFLEARGSLSEISVLSAMAHKVGPEHADSSMVYLKAVDDFYPLYGSLDVSGNDQSKALLGLEGGTWGILLSKSISERLGVTAGDKLRLGRYTYDIRGLIENEPDGNNQGFQLAPGVMVAFDSLKHTALVQPGSLIRYYNRIKLDQGLTAEGFKQELAAAYPDAIWRVKDFNDGASGMKRFVKRMGQFMSLVGLTALLVGGVGVSNGVQSYLNQKTNTIATFKILGSSSRDIMVIYLAQVLMMALVAIAAGLVVGALVPMILGELLSGSMPVALKMSIYPKPLLLAAFYSLMITLIFTLRPLGRAKNIPAAQLFRQQVSKSVTPKGSWKYNVLIGLLVLLLLGTVAYTADYLMVTVGFMVGAAVAFFLLYVTGLLIRVLARKVPRPHSPVLRIALSNIYRPGNTSISVVLSLGLGLVLFTAIALVEHNLTREIDEKSKGEAPSFFFLDIQKSQQAGFNTYLENTDSVENFRLVPNLRGRLTHIRGIAAKDVEVKPDGKWIVRGDRGMSFSKDLPKDNKLIAGEWWTEDYQGPPQVSISNQMAVSMDLLVGEEITVDILSRSITAEVSSIRDFQWGSFGINYVMMFDPVVLKAAPYTYVGTTKVNPAQENEVYRQITRQFPNVSIVRMKEILANALDIMAKLSTAIDVMAAITIFSGILVLAGAISAGHRNRIYEAAVLKTLGATRKDILRAYLYEFIILGSMSGLAAILLGTLAAYSVVTMIMKLEWVLPLDIPLVTVSGSILLTLLCGLVSIWLAMAARPAQVLRNNAL